jgi:hypothetical protein
LESAWVGRFGGQAEVVATEAGSMPFKFHNRVDIDQEAGVDQEAGIVYFTDISTAYQRRYVTVPKFVTGLLFLNRLRITGRSCYAPVM